MLFKFILAINDKIENFYREKPLHFNTVVQTSTSTNYYEGVNCPEVKSLPTYRTLKEVFGSYIYMESRSIITSSFNYNKL